MQPIQTQLTQLEQSGLIAIAKLLPELEYLFRHALVQDAAYESLLRKDRRVLHRTVAETLAATYADHPEHAATLAFHYHKAEDRERAHHYYWLAAQNALANYANAEAEHHYRFALLLADDDSERLAAMRQIGIALQRQSRNQEALDALQAAIPLAGRTGDLNQLAHLYASTAQVKWYSGDTPGALAFCREGLAQIGDAPASEGLALLLHEAARAHFFNGQVAEGMVYAKRALAMADALGLLSLKADTLITLGMLSDLPAEIGMYYHQGVELAEAHNFLRAAGRGRINLSALYGATGRLMEAVEQSLRAQEHARRLGDANMQLLAMQNSIECMLSLGRLDEAEQMLAAHAPIFASGVRPAWAVEGHQGYSGLLLCHRGEWAQGFPLVRHWIDGARQTGNLQVLAGIDLFFGEFLLQRGVLDEAEHDLSEAVRLGDQGIGIGPIMPRGALIAVLIAQGRLPDARQRLAEIFAIAAQLGYPSDSADIHMAQGRLAAAEERWQDAADLIGKVIAWCDQARLLPFLAWALIEQAAVMLHLGKRDQARSLLEQAHATYEAMGSAGYVALVRQRLSELSQESPA